MSTPFVLAPMAELSHRALRELIHSFGHCDEFYTEMISAPALVSGGPFEAYYIDPLPCPEKTVFQLVGSDEDSLVRAAAVADAIDCAGIDINMGCSAPAIQRTGAGVRWMTDPDKARRMIGRVRKTVRRRLSVKLRLGTEENFDYLVSFCRGLEDEGLELITLHPRTAGEKFRRRARWEYVGLLRKELGIPVAGNGDINSAEELIQRASGPWDAVMVGRLALRCPWIFAQARDMEQQEASGSGAAEARLREVDLEETALSFLELLERHQPPEFHKSRARRFFSYFCDNLIWAHYVKTLIGRESSLKRMGEVLSAYFKDHPEERIQALG